jgi:N-methylhydantoinase A/oxoprolinase/acetone carboxylase beta subunit
VAVRVGIDVGGTFTDLVALGGDRVVTAKVLSTPADQAVGVSAVLAAAGIDAGAIETLAHGTTVATNAGPSRARCEGHLTTLTSPQRGRYWRGTAGLLASEATSLGALT